MEKKILIVLGAVLLLSLSTYAYVLQYSLINVSFQIRNPSIYLDVYNYTSYFRGNVNFTGYLPSTTNISITNNYLDFLRYLPPNTYSINITVFIKVGSLLVPIYKLSFMTFSYNGYNGYIYLMSLKTLNNTLERDAQVFPVNYSNGEWFNSNISSSLLSRTFYTQPGSYEIVITFTANLIPTTLPQKDLVIKIGKTLVYLNFVS